jgi:membrane-bound lytic murein transglycosylase B
MLRKRILSALVASAVAGHSSGAAFAQADDRLPVQVTTTGSIDALLRAVTGEPQASRPPSGGGPAPWSGTSGASGHPLMTADAIRASAANFRHCLENIWPHAARRGVSRALFDQQTAGLTPDLRIMDLMDAQPEFTKAPWEYLDLLVTETRIQKGREALAANRATFDAVEKNYGVDRHVVAAIWGIESNYGTTMGERSVVRSTATLACVGRRQSYFREELLATLEILQRGDVRPEQMRGSWAGAFGPTQFMPTVFKRFAVDFDRDGHRNIVGSIPDMAASTAHNLKKNGWQAGQSWGYEVVLPRGFDYLHADRTRQHTVAQWEHLGIRRAGGKAFPRTSDHAFLLIPAGARGPGFLMLRNFKTIMSYNPAEAYALAIGHLADRLRGGESFVQAWPRDEQVLSRTERYEMQQRLASRGFDIGEPDGRLGSKTRSAIRDFQARAGLVPDGFASSTVLMRLRGQ